MATRPRGRPPPRGKGKKSGGRIQPTPPWEAQWRKASRASSDLCWQPEILAFMETTTGVRPSHGDVFRTLDSLASVADGLGALAALADVIDITEGTCDVESEIRALAKLLGDQSEATLFAGYLSPGTASVGDPSASAGRLLRAYREQNLAEMVAAANANPRMFAKRPLVGALTLTPLLAYELTREDDETPLDDRLTDSLDACPVPIAGAEGILDLLLVGLFGHYSPENLNETPAPKVARQVLANRPLVDRYLRWALGIEATMNNTKTSKSLPQCGQVLKATFAPKASLLAVMVSETPVLRRFRSVDAPPGSAYGLWQDWLKEISPKGHTHRTVGAFSPDDLATASPAGTGEEPKARLLKSLDQQRSLDGPIWADGEHALEGRVTWLTGLAEVLIGGATAAEVLPSPEALDTWTTFGPTGPTAAAQDLYLKTLLVEEVKDSEIDQVLKPDQRQQGLIEQATKVGKQIASALQVGDLAEDELRALSAWIELLSEHFGVDPKAPPEEFTVAEVGDHLPTWLAHTQWWLKHRAWRPKKERPTVEEDELPPPARVPPPVASAKDKAGTALLEPLVPDMPVRVVFAGGNEAQARHNAHIDGDLKEHYDGLVSVEWVHIDWSANWGKNAKQICGHLKRGADALVLMPLVRTGMGKHLRKEAGHLGVPWLPCTGQGRGAMTRSLNEAVQVVCQQRAKG